VLNRPLEPDPIEDKLAFHAMQGPRSSHASRSVCVRANGQASGSSLGALWVRSIH
jgi:hypothetical protein